MLIESILIFYFTNYLKRLLHVHYLMLYITLKNVLWRIFIDIIYNSLRIHFIQIYLSEVILYILVFQHLLYISCTLLLSPWFHTFFNARTNDSFSSVSIPLFSDMLLGFRIHLASTFSLRSAYSVKTVIDYVTVYRAHSSQNIRKKGVTPLSAVPLYAPLLHLLQAGNSVTGSYLLSVALKKISVSAVRTKPHAEVYVLAFCARFSAKCNAISPTQLHGSVHADDHSCCKDSDSISSGRRVYPGLTSIPSF